MSRIIRECSCRFLNSERRRAEDAAVDAGRSVTGSVRAGLGRTGTQCGYALFLVMMTITLILVALTAALPSIYMENQREKEAELIFRGNQYARAIFFFHTRFRRFPNSVDELLKTNGLRFLRKAYKDPMTKDGKWRFIHANAAGALLDSKTMKVQAGLNPFGGNQLGGSPGGTPGSPSSTGSSDQSSGGSANGQGAPTDQNQTQQADQSQNADQQPAGSTPQSPSIFGNNEGTTFGSFIAGVASKSHRASVRIWNNKKHYDEWEFLGVAMAGSPPIPGMVQGTGGTPGQPGAPGQPTPPTQPPAQQPVATPPPTANPVEPQPPNEPEQPAPEQPPPETEPPQ